VTVIVDSDIVIHVSRGRDADVLRRWAQLSQSSDQMLCSPVTVADVWGGARVHELSLLTELVNALVCLPINEQIGRKAGDYLREFGKSHGVEVPDALIAAAASLTGAALWTGNRKHYPMRDVAFY